MNSCERGFRVWEWEGVQDLSNSSIGGIGTRRGGRKLVCRFMAEKRQAS